MIPSFSFRRRRRRRRRRYGHEEDLSFAGRTMMLSSDRSTNDIGTDFSLMRHVREEEERDKNRHIEHTATTTTTTTTTTATTGSEDYV